MVAYTGIETISNMAEEARDYGKTIPRGIGLVVGAVAVIYTFLPAVALSAMPVKNGETMLALPEGGGRLRRRPGARRGGEHGPRLAPAPGRDLRRHPRGHDPLHRDQRRHPRRLAAQLLDGPAPPAARDRCACSTRASARRTSRSRVFSAIACLAILPGQADFLGVIYAFGAMLSFTIAHVAVTTLRIKRPDLKRPWKGPGNVWIRGHELPLYSLLGGLGHGHRAHRRDRPRRARRSSRASAGWCSGSRCT